MIVSLMLSWALPAQEQAEMDVNNRIPMDDNRSILRLNAQLSVPKIEKILNENFMGSKKGPSEGKFTWQGWNINLGFQDSLDLALEGKDLLVTLPLDIELKKKNAVFGWEQSVKGIAKITIKSKIGFTPQWSLSTESELKDVEWIKNPNLTVGKLTIPIAALTRWVIAWSKDHLEKRLDDEIQSVDVLRTQAESIWALLQKPVYNAEQNVWWIMDPFSISMEHPEGRNETIYLGLHLEAGTRLSFQKERPSVSIRKLPPLRFEDRYVEDSEMFVTGEINYDWMNEYIKKILEGQKITAKGRTIQIRDLEIYSAGDYLNVSGYLEGDLRGKMYFSTLPNYDETKREIHFEDFDFKLFSPQLLAKGAAFFLKKSIKKQIVRQLTYQLSDGIASIQQELNGHFRNYEMAHGFFLSGEITRLELANAHKTRKGIYTVIYGEGNFKLINEL